MFVEKDISVPGLLDPMLRRKESVSRCRPSAVREQACVRRCTHARVVIDVVALVHVWHADRLMDRSLTSLAFMRLVPKVIVSVVPCTFSYFVCSVLEILVSFVVWNSASETSALSQDSRMPDHEAMWKIYAIVFVHPQNPHSASAKPSS